MTKAQVRLEVEHEGFTQSRVYGDLPRQHLIVFTKLRKRALSQAVPALKVEADGRGADPLYLARLEKAKHNAW